MSEFFGVIALWIAVSLLAWWLHQRATGTRQQRQTALVRQAAERVAEAQAVFDYVRRGASQDGRRGDLSPEARLSRDTHALLKRIQERGGFFDSVNALRPALRQALLGEECEPLAEILHIRRDLWAASEIVLIENFRMLGPDFADEAAYERLRDEAVGVLFGAGGTSSGKDDLSDRNDLIDLRLSLACEEAQRFVADVEEAIRVAREHERLPTASEVIAYPVAAARALPGQVRTVRDRAIGFYAQVRVVAVTIRQSETMVRGLSELRRTRAELPQRVVAGLEKTSSAARQSATSVKGHYDFLVAAYDFQAKYEDLVRKAPELTERGKQFIARLELADKSERLKLTSATVRDAAKRHAVRGLAHVIAGLLRLQVALEKQLAAANTAASKGGASAMKAVGPSAVVAARTDAGRQPPTPASASKAGTESPETSRVTNRADKQSLTARLDAKALPEPGPTMSRAEKQLLPPARNAEALPEPSPGMLRAEADKAFAPRQALGGALRGTLGKPKAATAEAQPPVVPAMPPLKLPPMSLAAADKVISAKTVVAAVREARADTGKNSDSLPPLTLKGTPKPEKSTPATLSLPLQSKHDSNATPASAPWGRLAGETSGLPAMPSLKTAQPDHGNGNAATKAKAGTSKLEMPAVSSTMAAGKAVHPVLVAMAEGAAAEQAMSAPDRGKAAKKSRGWLFGSRSERVKPVPQKNEPAPTKSGSSVAASSSRAHAPVPSEAPAPKMQTAPSAAVHGKPASATVPFVSGDVGGAKKKGGGWLSGVRSRAPTSSAGGSNAGASNPGLGSEAAGIATPSNEASASASVPAERLGEKKQTSAPAKAVSKVVVPASAEAATPAAAGKATAPKKRGGWLFASRSKQSQLTTAASAVSAVDASPASASALPQTREDAASLGAVPPSVPAGSTQTDASPAQKPAAGPLAPEPLAAEPAAHSGAATSANPPLLCEATDTPRRARASLAAKLTSAAPIDAADDTPGIADEPDIAPTEAENDDPGPLTQSILESRARQDEKPGRSQSRAFPWLRR